MPNFTSYPQILRKFWKISRSILLVLIALIVLVWLAIQITPVQNFLMRQVTSRLSKDLHTSIRIRHVNFNLFNKMNLEGVLVKDLNNDTLLSAGTISVNITDWFFFKDRIVLKYVGMSDARILAKRTDSTWNYQFLIDYFSGGKNNTAAKKPLELALEKLKLSNIHIVQQDAWRGENLQLAFEKLELESRSFSIREKKIHLRALQIEKPVFSIFNYTGNRPDSLRPAYAKTKIVNDPDHLRWNPDNWDITIDRVLIKDGIFRSEKHTSRAPYASFDGNHIEFSSIQGDFTDARFNRDTIRAHASLSTRERSGLQVKSLDALLKFYPEAMQFDRLDLRTANSHLHRFFSMNYASFDDMGEFISRVTLEGNFDGSSLSSDDIAYFAPELKDWKTVLNIRGKIKGPLDNLQAKNLLVQAGNNSILQGDIKMTGLPETDKIYIDFKAKEVRTTYNDALVYIPALRSINQPRLDLLQYFRFTGNFTGFLRDFVTYGTLETNLGTVATDVNMKFSKDGLSRYKGSINTTGFELGKFIDVSDLGKISFRGEVDGSGISMEKLMANLDGTIDRLEFKNYPYQNIQVKGTVARKLFNGELVSGDPNLDARLNGLIDFSQQVPRFDLKASVDKADLYQTHFTQAHVEFNGKFNLNFSGNNIDNFLGTARVADASLYKNGERVPFDSLYLESKIMDSSKVITVISNEFDGALVGEFSVKDLPLAFESFLSKYYPSYFKPARSALKNENFSFVITTKNVDDYLNLITDNIRGFNYSTITGRINSRENLLDLNADIPQFSFNKIGFYNLSLKGTGNYDSLTVTSNIADIYISDSLHFPGTTLQVKASNDRSEVSILTSASQALNAANLKGTVITRPKGVEIIFNESSFDINGKNWTIDKNGELILSRDLVSAEGLRIYNGQQEIRVTTHPSDIGYSNDIRVEMKKINIGDFTPYVVSSNRFEGLMTGTLDIMNPFGKIQLDLQGNAEQFRLDDDSIGLLQLSANYNQQNGRINFSGVSDNNNYHFDVQGLYNILDSTSDKPIDISTHFTDTRINLIERYLTSIFSGVDGFATGDLQIVGEPGNMKYLGKAKLREGKLKVNYTNVTYKIPEASVLFRDDAIDFGSFVLKDTLQNQALVTRGILKHKSFGKMAFDFALQTNNLLVLNTNGLNNDPYFGKVFAKANMTLTGPIENMLMSIRGEPSDSSDFYIRSGAESRVSGQASFIVWKIYGREMEAQEFSKESKLTVALDVTANNLANMYVIIDELTGDIIKANGNGNLKIRATTDGELTLTGQYDIDRGNYNFNFQSLLHKPFVLRQDAGSYIRWNGDPYDAEMFVVAEYEADNVKFSDLGNQLWAQIGGSDDNIRKYRGKIKVVAKLTGKLMKPDIQFDLEMPSGSPLRNDPLVQNILKQIKNDQNELNKQVAFLILFNSFGPLSTSSQTTLGSQAMEGIVASSISGYLSGALSKQFSNIFRKIFNDESIRVNFNAQLYNGSNLLDNVSNTSNFAINRTNLSLSLNKSLFNERLTFTFGSSVDFGLTSEQVRATRNLQFLPDITMEWKIRPDGKLVLSFFYRDSFNNLSSVNNRQNRSGASISYRRDFEKFGDLWRSEKKKKKTKSNGEDDKPTAVNQGPN